MNKLIKQFVKSNSTILSLLYYVVMNNRVRGSRGNVFHRNNAYVRGLRLLFYGKNNEIILGGKKPSVMKGLRIEIHGSNNRVVIEGGVGAKDLFIYCADQNCIVHIMENTQISGRTELATMEGSKIKIGKNSLLSANITLRAGDSHSVMDVSTGKRINPSRDVLIGDHVWIGNTVIVTKGTIIGSDSVVGTGSVVVGKTFPNNCIIAGNPAKIIKEDISWRAEKL